MHIGRINYHVGVCAAITERVHTRSSDSSVDMMRRAGRPRRFLGDDFDVPFIELDFWIDGVDPYCLWNDPLFQCENNLDNAGNTARRLTVREVSTITMQG